MRNCFALLAVLLGSFCGVVEAGDVYWQGIDNINGTASDTDIDSTSLWDTNNVPVAGDTAYLVWDQTDTLKWGNLIIPAGSTFAPDNLVISATASTYPYRSTDAQLQIDKDMTFGTLTMNFGYQTSGGDANVLVGSASAQTLTLTNSTPLSFGGDRGSWASLSLGSLGSTLRFSGSSYTFNEYNTNYAHSWSKAQGFRPMGGTNGYVDFTDANATITLGDLSGYNQRYPQASYVPPAMDLGYNALRVYSTQTWNNSVSGTGLIRVMVARDAILPDANHNILVTSLDATLPDLSAVPFRIQRSDTVGNASSFDIPGASYQSLEIYNSGHNWTHGSQTYFTGDVTLAGGTLETLMNGTYADGVVQTDWSLYIHNADRATRVYLQGHTVGMAKGMRIQADSLSNYNDITRVDVTGATLNIGTGTAGGDLVLWAGAGAADAGESRRIGLYGDADTTINLSGSFSANTASADGDNLYLSTMNLLAGTEALPNTFEVDARRADAVAAQTFAIGVLNVGAGAAAHVLLVNDYLNDNCLDDTTKDGEVLLAGELTIGQNSTLDLAGQNAKVGSSLSIDATGWLDLNTGLALGAGDIVDRFFGVGNQTSTWATFQDRVTDSSNAGLTFVPTYVAGDDATYWQVVPEPTSLGLLTLAAVGLLRRRRA